MRKFFTHLSLTQKLTAYIMATTALALMLASLCIGLFQVITTRENAARELTAMADVIGANCAAALRFNVADDAELSLASLEVASHIQEAHLYLPDGTLFAIYQRERDAPSVLTDHPRDEGHTLTRHHVVLARTIVHDNDAIGTVLLASDIVILYRTLRMSFVVLAVVFSVGCTLAFLFSSLFLRLISHPVTSLVDTSTQISATGNYTLRAKKYNDDDLGNLTDRFNNMIAQIQQRDQDLQRTHDELARGLNELHEEQEALKESREREGKLQDQLARSERMESLGLLAGGVAHDLNNILGPIVAYPDLIKDSLPPDSQAYEDVQQIQQSALKAAAVIQDLLTLGRRGSYQKQPVNVNALIEEYLMSASFLARWEQHRKVRILRELDKNATTIEGSPHHLGQVIMNLVINALEAMDTHGTLTVRTRPVSLPDTHLGQEVIAEGDYVEVSVTDTGSGISPDDLGHIFEPFYTRKTMGRSGSGLGLAVVYGVVKDLGGYIDVDSTEGEGTTFHLYFQPAEEADSSTVDLMPDGSGQGRILIVDDVKEQRDLASRILQSLGYTTETAIHGHEGLERIQQEYFDLVILDMIMEKGFDGLDTFRAIREQVPDQRCIIASGFSESDRVKAALAEGAGGFIPKPYTRDALAMAVQTQLANAPHTATPQR